MAIITLTSDWGTKDHYIASVKGVILTQIPAITLVDITHEIPVFNLHHASFVVRHAFPNFPEGTIHIIDIGSDTPQRSKYLLGLKNGQFFIAPDNGLFSLLFFESPPETVVEISVPEPFVFSTFVARDLFAVVACKLASGEDLLSLGSPRDVMGQKVPFTPVVDKDMIKGRVLFVDNYDNAFVNITSALFEQVGQKREFTLFFHSYEIDKISHSYHEVGEAEMVAIFNTAGMLEIALNRANAAGLLGLHTDEVVRIEFRD